MSLHMWRTQAKKDPAGGKRNLPSVGRGSSKPTPESIILGDIVEKQVTAPKVPGSEEMDMDPQIDAGFPRVEKIQFTVNNPLLFELYN